MGNETEVQTNEGAPAASSGNPTGGSEDVRIKKMQAALNAKHTELVEKTTEFQSLLSAKDAEAATYRTKLAELDAALREKSSLLAEVSTKLTEKEAAAATAAKFKEAAKRGLMKEFEDGLLRVELPDEDFVKHLDAFVARLNGTTVEAQKSALQSASPPAGGTRESAATKAQLQQRLNEAVMNYSTDPKAYDDAYKALMEFKE